MRRIAVLSGVVAVAVLLTSGCVRVNPAQRELLADPSMQPAPQPQIDQADKHTANVREGSGGADGTAAGGCGCN